MKAFFTSLQQQQAQSENEFIAVQYIWAFYTFACVRELVFESLHAIDTFTKRKSVTKQRDKACKQDINKFYCPVWIGILDSNSWGFESFRFGILNCPSLPAGHRFRLGLTGSHTKPARLARRVSSIDFTGVSD